MPHIDEADTEQSLVTPSTPRAVEVHNAPPVRLQTLDLARHVAIAPDSKRYVVATFDDTHLKRGYITAVYPQQGGYLTLFRLVVVELSSETPEQALQRHVSAIQSIQQGKLDEVVASQS